MSLARSLRPWFACVGAMLALSCLTPGGPPASTATEKPTDTATFEGFVIEMDGQYTRNDGGRFEIPEGCHVFKTTADNLIAATESSGVVVQVHWLHVPVVYFRVDAHRGFRYLVERTVEKADVQFNVMVVVLRTFDANGNLVSTQQIAVGPEHDTKVPTCT